MSSVLAQLVGPRPTDILATSRAVMNRPADGWGSSWTRAAAFFIRQALEETVASLWSGPLAGLEKATFVAQLICLRQYLGDPDLARRIQLAWCSLSNACHAHPYELGPTISELQAWSDTVEDLLRHLEAAANAGVRVDSPR